jgi:putative FmdB family regulatory protein
LSRKLIGALLEYSLPAARDLPSNLPDSWSIPGLRAASRGALRCSVMPLYDFRCRGCGHEFEALVRPPETSILCPSCRQSDVERMLSAFAVSTDERRSAAAKASRRAQIRGRKDAIIADEEYRRKHDD